MTGLTFHATHVEKQEDGWRLTGASVRVEVPFRAVRFFRHGWHSWSLTTWLDVDTPYLPPGPRIHFPQIDDPVLLDGTTWQSAWLSGLEAPEGQVILLAALDLNTRITATATTLEGHCETGSAQWLVLTGPEERVFEAYARALAQQLGRRGNDLPPRVWCSWYGLYADIAEPVLLATLQGLDDLPFDVFQIDDGWQQDIGDWEPNAQFPSGMAAMAQAIAQTGRRAGLWLAPFVVRPTAHLYREHPEWILRDTYGRPVWAGYNWGGPIFALDTTREDVQDWLISLIRKVRTWGYTYLKLDFLYAAALPGRRHRDIPRETALREALIRLREAAGEDTYLLLCGVPILPALGLADGLRVGPDTAPYWDNPLATAVLHNYAAPGAQNALRTTLHRLWLRPLVHVDPDVVFFRTQFSLLHPREKDLLRHMARMTGFRGTSDLPFWLLEHERHGLRRFWEEDPPTVTRLERYRFRIGEDTVDFGHVVPLPVWPQTPEEALS